MVLELKAIALFSFIQLPYVLKFLWAPLFDGFSFSMGRRRGWLIIFQVLLLVSISVAGFYFPKSQIMTVAIISTAIAFFSASQDAVIDAYRRELLLDNELGLGTAIHVNAYKFSQLIPGSLALILADSLRLGTCIFYYWLIYDSRNYINNFNKRTFIKSNAA